MTTEKRAAFGAIILVILIIVGDLAAGFLGIGSPSAKPRPDCTNNVPAILQCGTTSVTISAGTTTAFTAVTFPVAFAQIPNVTATSLGAPPPGIFASGFTFQAQEQEFKLGRPCLRPKP